MKTRTQHPGRCFLPGDWGSFLLQWKIRPPSKTRRRHCVVLLSYLRTCVLLYRQFLSENERQELCFIPPTATNSDQRRVNPVIEATAFTFHLPDLILKKKKKKKNIHQQSSCIANSEGLTDPCGGGGTSSFRSAPPDPVQYNRNVL